MSPVTDCSPPSHMAQLCVIISLFWPFLAASFLSRRGTSAGPIAAVLVPLALSVAGMLMGIVRAIEGMTIMGTPRIGAAVSAGIAEALGFTGIGAGCTVLVIIVAAIRRHRPYVDRLTATIFALLFAEVIAALFLVRSIANERWQFYAWLTGAAVAAIAAIVAAFWAFRTGRGRTTSQPIPYGITIFVIASVILGLFVRQEMLGYMWTAMGH